MQSRAESPEAYLAEQPEDRRVELAVVRELIKQSLPEGYKEQMGYGMINFTIPLELFPTKTKIPYPVVALAAQKNCLALYLVIGYYPDRGREGFMEAYKASGKRLDMGKSCIHFKRAQDLPLELIQQTLAATDMKRFIEDHKTQRSGAIEQDL